MESRRLLLFCNVRRSGGQSQLIPVAHVIVNSFFTMRCVRWIGAALLAAGLCIPLPAQAQQPDSTELRRFRLADSYLRAGRTDRAITMLEDLYAESPSTYVFYDKLKEAYESVKRYDDAIALVEERMQQQRTPTALSEKARLLYLNGNEEKAFATWDQALELAPDQQNAYTIVYRALVDLRRFERAIEVLQRGREALDSPNGFRTQMAYLYSLTGQHEQAIQEYLALLAENEQQLGFVQNRLSTFIEQDDALSASISAAEKAIRDEPLNQSYRELLAWLYLEDEQYTAAFDVYRALDRLGQTEGQRLLRFARQAADANAFEAAQKAYQEILDRYSDSSAAPEAKRGLGDVHRRWAEHLDERVFDAEGNRIAAPHYEAAVDAYRAYLEEHPNQSAVPHVLRQLGRLQQDVFHRLNEAEATLQRVVDEYPESQAVHEARYDLGRTALMRGELDEARLTFSRLVNRAQGDLAEQARYELALIHFYRGELDAAQTQAAAAKVNTSTDVANDAIGLNVLILQNKGPDSLNTPLRLYGEAKLLQRQRQHDAALQMLDSLLTTYGNHGLADEVRFQRARILREQRRPEAAQQAFAELPLMHPKSPLADRSLFAAAELQAEALNNPEAALNLYRRLLEDYPQSLLASEVRSRIRSLQQRSGNA